MSESPPLPRPQGRDVTAHVPSSHATPTAPPGTQAMSTTATAAVTTTATANGKRKAASQLVEPAQTKTRKTAPMSPARAHHASDEDEFELLLKRNAVLGGEFDLLLKRNAVLEDDLELLRARNAVLEALNRAALDPKEVEKQKAKAKQHFQARLGCHEQTIGDFKKQVHSINHAWAAERRDHEGEIAQLKKALERQVDVNAAQTALIAQLLAPAATGNIEGASNPASSTSARPHRNNAD